MWSRFVAERPRMARFGTALLAGRPVEDGPDPLGPWSGIGFLATMRLDGAGPRLTPVCPIMTTGRMLVALVAPKDREIEIDNRYTLHAMLGPAYEEFSMRGRASRADDAATRAAARSVVEETAILGGHVTEIVFELDVACVHTAVWRNLGRPDIWPERKSWTASAPETGTASGA